LDIAVHRKQARHTLLACRFYCDFVSRFRVQAKREARPL
jgi:hypothetical protein